MLSSLARRTLLTLTLIFSLAAPAMAQDATDGPSMMDYGWTGLTTGLGVGFAAGYLAMGPTYQSGEWRSMVYGTGIGGLSGMGLGLMLGLIDVGAAPQRPAFIMLRDIGVGSGLGAVAGLIVGTMFALGKDGELRDLSDGAAYGTLIGAGAGVVFGMIEAIVRGNASSGRAESEAGPRLAESSPVRFTITGAQDSGRNTVLMPTLYGAF